MVRDPSSPILQNLVGCVVAGCSGNTAARVGASAAHIKPLDGRAVVAVPEHGAGAEHLVQAQVPVHNITVVQDAPLTIVCLFFHRFFNLSDGAGYVP